MTREILSTPRAAEPPPTDSLAAKAGGLIFVPGIAPIDLARIRRLKESIAAVAEA